MLYCCRSALDWVVRLSVALEVEFRDKGETTEYKIGFFGKSLTLTHLTAWKHLLVPGECARRLGQPRVPGKCTSGASGPAESARCVPADCFRRLSNASGPAESARCVCQLTVSGECPMRVGQPRVLDASMPGEWASGECLMCVPANIFRQACHVSGSAESARRLTVSGESAKQVGQAKVPGECARRMCQLTVSDESARRECQARVPGECASLVFQASVPDSSLALTA
ncbi:hypothetical protein J6590_102073 [Homalodisca vitripennis]|nr:hypothetical protein J6590_088819 [Homalodisca vitripennis]KAG8260203.1 hypothetical protein J6590_102073 [Homalodisca vitripennis]